MAIQTSERPGRPSPDSVPDSQEFPTWHRRMKREAYTVPVLRELVGTSQWFAMK